MCLRVCLKVTCVMMNAIRKLIKSFLDQDTSHDGVSFIIASLHISYTIERNVSPGHEDTVEQCIRLHKVQICNSARQRLDVKYPA